MNVKLDNKKILGLDSNAQPSMVGDALIDGVQSENTTAELANSVSHRDIARLSKIGETSPPG